eukprot:Gb_16678 [translate_table: standard]
MPPRVALRGRRGLRREDVDDLLRRLEAVETRLQEDDSEDEGQAIQPHPQVQDPFERLIEAFTKQRKKEKVHISEFLG